MNNNYEIDFGDDFNIMRFESNTEVFPGDPLWNDRLKKYNKEAAIHSSKPLYTQTANGTDIGPNKKPNP